jgi:hypothetical protein
MSDLAPFVAAVLKDSVTADLLEENRKLRLELQKCRTVSITGPNGAPVYAVGRFEEGMHSGNPNLWAVSLHETGVSFSLADLRSVEVRLGGICRAMFAEEHQGYADDEYNAVTRTTMISFFFSRLGSLWLDVQVGPFPGVADYAEILPMDNDYVSRYLSEDLAGLGTVFANFRMVQFVITSVSGVVDSLNLDIAVLEEAERRRQERTAMAEEFAMANDDEDTDSDTDIDVQD